MKRLILCLLALLAVTSITFAQRVVSDDIPEAMPLVDMGDDDMSTFLIFGTATANPSNPGLADMLMLVEINRTANSVAMLALPRDLWVYAPDAGMMKLNSAWLYGETHEVEGGGLQLLKDTIRYNLGIEVDHYAQVNFDGFLALIDELGGIDIAVDCAIQDWRLKSPELDKHVEENYEMFTLPVGLHHMDADTALWYVRSRRTSSDIDRGRRQQDVMRAMWRQIRADDLLDSVPSLWNALSDHVHTDLTLPDILSYVPFALNIAGDDVQTFRMNMGDHIINALSPEPEYSAILAMQREGIAQLMQDFVTPSGENRLERREMIVQIVNAGWYDELSDVAFDRLAQEGFTPVIIEEQTHDREYTAIYDYVGGDKGSALPELMRILRVSAEGVVIEPNPNRDTDYKIYLGDTYLFRACNRNVIQPIMYYNNGVWTAETLDILKSDN